MELDIYDFDHTLFPMDSGSRFYIYCLFHYPWILIFFPYQLFFGLLMIFHIINMTVFKRYFFCFVQLIPLEEAVKKFWDKHEKTLFPWFKERTRYAVVISASPDFLLNEISKRLKFDCLICTVHDKKTGKIIGENCRDEEKIRRFHEKFPNAKVIDVYSDSIKHDKAIFSLGENCWHIVKGEKQPFKFEEMYKA